MAAKKPNRWARNQNEEERNRYRLYCAAGLASENRERRSKFPTAGIRAFDSDKRRKNVRVFKPVYLPLLKESMPHSNAL